MTNTMLRRTTSAIYNTTVGLLFRLLTQPFRLIPWLWSRLPTIRSLSGGPWASSPLLTSAMEPFHPQIRREVMVFIAIVVAIVGLLHAPQGITNGIHGVQAQKQKLMDNGVVAMTNLKNTQKALERGDISGGLHSLELAQQSFEELNRQFHEPESRILRIVGYLPFTTRWHQGRDIATIGSILSAVGTRLLSSVEQYQNTSGSTTNLLQTLAQESQWAAGQLRTATTLSQSLTDIPGVGDIQKTLALSGTGMDRFAAAFGALQSAIGGKSLKRYLVIFENSAELRPAGGFMGSFALVDVANGVIKHQEFPKGGSYDLQGSLKLRLRPPEPLSVFRNIWQFHDANWFVDWPTTARTLKTLYEHSEGPSVDGVVAVTSPVIEKLMTVIGPITVDGEQLTAENIIDVIQHKVEVDYDRVENSPKKYIEQVATALQQRFAQLTTAQIMQLLQLLDDSIHQKLVLAYTDDVNLNTTLQELGALGEVRSTDGDYFQMVSANIGGAKTDRVIRRDIRINSVVSDDGRMLNNVQLHRSHQGVSGQEFYGVKNIEYVRFYVPEGSRLIRANGFIPPPRLFREASIASLSQSPDVKEYPDRLERFPQWQITQTTEFGKTVFGGWLELNAGSSQDVELVYEPPLQFTYEKAHTLLIQKQPGEIHTRVQYALSLPSETNILVALPEILRAPESTATASFRSIDLTSDQLYGIIARVSSKTP